MKGSSRVVWPSERRPIVVTICFLSSVSAVCFLFLYVLDLDRFSVLSRCKCSFPTLSEWAKCCEVVESEVLWSLTVESREK